MTKQYKRKKLYSEMYSDSFWLMLVNILYETKMNLYRWGFPFSLDITLYS